MTVEDDLRAVWEEVPGIRCVGLCTSSCGPIGMTEGEAALLKKYLPFGVPTMTEMVERFHREGQSYRCPLLVNGRCSAYDVRPTVCRLWGVVESMPCPYGCVPDRWLSDEEGHVFLDKVNEAGGGTRI